MSYKELFNSRKAVLAMIHLKGADEKDRLGRAVNEIGIYYENGVDAVIIEDYFGTKRDVENVLSYLSDNMPDRIYGVNVLDNFHRSYELAQMFNANFLQVDSLAGHLPPALDAPYGKMIDAYRSAGDILIFGGIRFKYQPVLSGRTLEEDLAIGMKRSDAIVVTGEGTGMDTDIDKIAGFRRVIGDFPLIVGAGTTPGNVVSKLALADGVIVGSSMKDTGKDTGEVTDEKVRAFIKEVDTLKKSTH